MGKIVFVLAAVTALMLTACGGDGGGETAGATGTTGGGASSDCVDLTSGETFTITISNFTFEPDCFTTKASQGITIVNEDGADHTFTINGTQVDVTVGAGETFNGESVSGVVAPGTYDLRCRFHPQMTGTITVE
jgi:plastocyanin